mmetsp:Transcript_71864/g.171729  ORF Transcript_71864/g.171729 Transcript_71864/m.171729 type:complete len:207 (-) Transcript_71864:816-1436(-)
MSSKANIRKNSTSSVRATFAPSLAGTLGNSQPLMNLGQQRTARTVAKTIRATPKTGFTTTATMSNSPPNEKSTLNRIRDRMSSTKAAVMIACPKFSCKTPASPSSRRAMPTLVGASAVPAEMPCGKNGFPYTIVKAAPVTSGRTVPMTATTHALGPTTFAFSKSKCIPLSKIINATPACPINVNTSGVSWHSCEISASHVFTRHSS